MLLLLDLQPGSCLLLVFHTVQGTGRPCAVCVWRLAGDNGNNAFLTRNDVAAFLPYGLDFPIGPTGRYTNGKNAADVLAVLLKHSRFIPAVLDPKAKGEMILIGVNYASGGSRVLHYQNVSSSTCIHLISSKKERAGYP